MANLDNYTKYSFQGEYLKLEEKLRNANDMIQKANTVEELEQAKAWIDIALNEYNYNINKIMNQSNAKGSR